MKKKYNINYDVIYDVVIEVDHDIMTDELLHEINNFWSGNSERLEKEDGDVLIAVLKMLTQVVLQQVMETGRGVRGIIRLFDWVHNGIEGWPAMDGSAGITILAVDEVIIDTDLMLVGEIRYEGRGSS